MWFSYTDEGVLELHILREDDEQPEVEDHVVSNDCVLKKFIDEQIGIYKSGSSIAKSNCSTSKGKFTPVIPRLLSIGEECELVVYSHESEEGEPSVFFYDVRMQRDVVCVANAHMYLHTMEGDAKEEEKKLTMLFMSAPN